MGSESESQTIEYGKEVLADPLFDHWVSSLGFSGIWMTSVTFSAPGSV